MQLNYYHPCSQSGSFVSERRVAIVNDAEIANPDMVRSIRNFCAAIDVPAGQMLDYLADTYRDLGADVIGDHGLPIFLDLTPLETDPDDLDLLVHCKRAERIRDWFRTMTTPVPEHVTPYVRGEAKERFRILATIIIASNPDIAWPRILPANDNTFAANDNGCRTKTSRH